MAQAKPIRVVHLSPTPLVGAPAKLARLPRSPDFLCWSISLSDYPKDLAGLFTGDTILWNGKDRVVEALAERLVAEADIVHVHNDLPSATANRVYAAAPNATYIYQSHSPLREPPLYIDRAETIGLPFVQHLVVAQHQTRQFGNYLPIPNVVERPPSIRPIQPGEKLRVLYSPTHGRDLRWGGKVSPELDAALTHLHGIGIIEAIRPDKPIPPHTLFELRRTSHVTIDEIATGGFHQVSLEGLACGNVVINGADLLSRLALAEGCGTTAEPPFVEARPSTITSLLMGLARDPDRVAALQQASLAYFASHMTRDSLAERLENLYRTSG